MKKILAVLTLVGLMAIPAIAQDTTYAPLVFEIRGTFSSDTQSEGKSFDFRPSFGLMADIGLPVDFGISYTSSGLPGGDGEESMELLVSREIRTWYWGDGKSIKLEVYAASDIVQEKTIQTRVYALGLIYDHGLLEYTKIGIRGAWVNRDQGPNDWFVQGLIQIDALK